MWDADGRFGGPEDLFSDGALAAAAVNGDGCLFAGNHLSDISDVTWKALRTDTQVNDQDKAGQTSLSKIAIKADASATTSQEQIYFIGGTWNDDGDATPENSEVGCTGGTLTTLAIS